MGFYINEFENELKQHINLSDNAWIVINEDIQNLTIKNEKSESFSGFLNRIFFNFYQQANATVSIRSQEYKNKFLKLFEEPGATKKSLLTAEQYASKIVPEYEKELISAANSYPKGEGRKFRVNKQNLDVLRSSDESRYYETTGLYIKAILEEYARKQTYEREQIYFKDTVDKINLSLKESAKLKIHIIQNQFGHEKRRQFYVTPYKIAQDKVGMYNYLVGYSEEILEDGSTAPKVIASFRISKIKKISVMHSMNAFISKSSLSALEKELNQNTAQYLLSDLIDVKVQFKKSGLERFYKKVYMRPVYYEKVDDLTYVFHCTRRQAEIYFFGFGSDLKILEPSDLKRLFAKRYEKAALQYCDVSEEDYAQEPSHN